MKNAKTFRFKLTERMCDNISYLTVGPTHVRLCGSQGTPFALANITKNSVELEWALRDEYDKGGKRVGVNLKTILEEKSLYVKKIELVNP